MDFKKISEFPCYEINNDGLVLDTRTGEFVEPFEDQKGYYRVSLNHNGVYTNKKIHRLLAEAFIPNPNNYPCVDHINRNRKDNRLENLRWVPHTTNAQNRSLPNTNTTGEMNITLQKDGSYEIQITREGKMVYRHREKTLEEAVKARDTFLATGKETRKQTATNQKNITKTESGYRVTFRQGRKAIFDKRVKTLEEAIFARDSFLASI